MYLPTTQVSGATIVFRAYMATSPKGPWAPKGHFGPFGPMGHWAPKAHGFKGTTHRKSPWAMDTPGIP